MVSRPSFRPPRSDVMAATALVDEQKAALQRFRERRGGLSEERREQQRRLLQERKAIRTALAAPATVPELAQATGLLPRTVLWHVTAMRKYGQVQEADQEGDYPRYALIVETEAA